MVYLRQVSEMLLSGLLLDQFLSDHYGTGQKLYRSTIEMTYIHKYVRHMNCCVALDRNVCLVTPLWEPLHTWPHTRNCCPSTLL